jgi:hypothetical protein
VFAVGSDEETTEDLIEILGEVDAQLAEMNSNLERVCDWSGRFPTHYFLIHWEKIVLHDILVVVLLHGLTCP